MTEEEWLTSDNPQRMLDSLEGGISERKLRLFACACVRRVWHHLTRHESREVAGVVEWYADSQAPLGELKQARSLAWDISGEFDEASDALEDAADGRFQAESLAAGAVANACGFNDKHSYFVRVTSTAHKVAEAAWHAAGGAGRPADAAREAEWLAQANLLRDIFGNPFRPLLINPAWMTSTVTTLATAAYEQRALPCGELDLARLAVLADALEEAGCTDQTILDHLRGPGPHVRGCFALDLILGRS